MKKVIIMIICILMSVNYTLADKTHIVQRGESIVSISEYYNISEKDLIETNPGIQSLFYVGMKLNIPETQSADSGKISQNPKDEIHHSNEMTQGVNDDIDFKYENNIQDPNQNDSFESLRNGAVIEIGYSAETFKYPKESGYYGVSMTTLPWKLANMLYGGVHFSPLNFNFGLNEYTCDVIKLGPAIGYYFTPQIFVAVPLDVECAVSFVNTKTKASWGMSLAPSVYIGNKYGVFLGPLFTLGFSGNSKISCGFRVGFYL